MKRLTEDFDFDNENQIDNEFEGNVKNLSFLQRSKKICAQETLRRMVL